MLTTTQERDTAKAAVGRAVADLVTDGMVIGVGTGSTATKAIEAIGERIRSEALVVQGVPTSFASEQLARQQGITIASLDSIEALDLAFDGADEVDPQLQLIKGRGAAQSREKVVAKAARSFLVLVDDSKLVDQLGTKFPVPIEFIPLALGPVKRLILSLGGKPELRMAKAKDGPVVTDQGLWILDAHFDGIDDPHFVDKALSTEPGVLDHGLFLDMTTQVFIGRADGSVRTITP
ncbi:MAG: ribose-5-phosphate isomerase RpiA [Rhodothermales bacterium]|nr:ribose-5-phosphate isomerase RpiA [Rhodothermales bacterium]